MSDGDATISGQISNGGLTKSQSGTLNLTGANLHAGTTTISAGVLHIENNDALGTTAAGTVVSSGGALEIETGLTVPAEALSLTGSGVANGGALRNVANNNTFGGAITLAGNSRINTDAQTLTLGSTINAAGNTLFFGGNGTDIDVEGTVSGAGSVLIKDGSSRLSLEGANDYTGATIISNGIVEIAADSGLGTAPGGATAGHLSINGGDLQSAATFELDSNRGIALGASGGTMRVNSSRTLTYDGIIAGSGALTKELTGTLLLGGASTFTGATIINGGTVRISTGDNNLGTPPGVATPGHITIDGGLLYASDVDITLNANRGIAIGAGDGTIRVSSGETLTYDGIIAGAGNDLTKELTGTLTLGGPSTYSGTTTVDAGDLIHNGTNTSSAITVDAGATLGGIGTVGPVTVNGDLIPGPAVSGVGTLTVTGLTMNAGSIFRCEIGNFLDTTSRDSITNRGVASFTSSTVSLDSSTLSNWDSTTAKTWIIMEGSVTSTNGIALDQTTDWDDGTYDKNGGVFSLSASGGNLVLDFTPPPGPSVEVSGNGVVIADGDPTPTSADHTDYGEIYVEGGTQVRTYTITNSGAQDLVLGEVTTNGTHASDFTVTTQPALTIYASSSTTFQVTFNPSGSGVRSAELSFTNNVAVKNPYNFAIQGFGLWPIIDPDPTSLSSTVMLGETPAVDAFTITNINTGVLTYTLTTNVYWLSVAPGSGSLGSGTGQQHTATYSVAGLTVGVSNGTITVTDGNASNSPVVIPVTLTITNIPDASAQSATVDGNELVRLAWTKPTNHDVLILYKSSAIATDPTPGQLYTVGQTIDGATVIYKASGAALDHVVGSGSTANYKFYAIHNNYYSPGVTASATLGSYVAGEIVEPFAYTNGVALGSLDGGNGFSGAWSTAGLGTFVIETNYSSASVPIFSEFDGYPSNTANRLKLTDMANDDDAEASRSFPAISSGKIYASAMLSYAEDGASKYIGLSFMSNTTERAFFGEIFTQNHQLGLASFGGSDVGSSYDMNPFSVGNDAGVGKVYVVIGAYDFTTRELKTVAYHASTSIPGTEPVVWDASTNLAVGRIATLDGIRFAAGSGDSGATIGDCYVDEIRVATNWVELLQITGPVLYVDPAALTFNAQRAHDPVPTMQSYVISNSNVGTLSYTSTVSYSGSATGWLSLSSQTGDLDAGEGATITATVTSWDLPTGTYIATNTIVGSGDSGVEDVVITLSVTGFSDNVSYDTFSYTSGFGLEGQSGGYGWSGAWADNDSVTPLPYVGSSSLASFDNYCNDGGNDAAVDMANCGGGGEAPCANLFREAYRSFPEISSGVVYLGFKVKAQFMGNFKDFGVTLSDNGTPKVSVGKVDSGSDELGILAGTISLTGYTLNAGSEYLIIMRYDLDSGEIKVQGYFGNNLGTDESWLATTKIAPAGSTPVNRVSLYARNGSLSETPGIVEWDDVRIARTWSDLLCGLTEPQDYPVVSNVVFHGVDSTNRVSDAYLSTSSFPIALTFYDRYIVNGSDTASPFFIPNFDLTDSNGDSILTDQRFDATNFTADLTTMVGSNAFTSGLNLDGIEIGDVTLTWSAINSNEAYRINNPVDVNGSNITFTLYDEDVDGPVPQLIYIGANYVPGGPIQTSITDGDLNNTNDLVDIAFTWSDPNGVFMTNSPPNNSDKTHIAANEGRVVPNWDLISSNPVTTVVQDFGYNEVFTNFFGYNGATIVTTAFENAFLVTNINLGNVLSVTVSAEDDDNDRGTYADPLGPGGDDVPHDRAITVDSPFSFVVTDDDADGPLCTAFVFSGDALGVGNVYASELAAGSWAITGIVEDVYSGIRVNGTVTTQPTNSPYVQLIDPNGIVRLTEVFGTIGFANGDTNQNPIGHFVPSAITASIQGGVWTALVVVADVDDDRIGDTAITTNVLTFNVLPTYEWDAEGGTDRDWSNVTNWTANIEPTVTHTAHINGSYTAVVSVADQAVLNLFVGDDGFNGALANAAGNVEQSGGLLDIGNSLVLGENVGDVGRYTISGGSLVVTGLTIIGDSGLGLMTVTGTAAVTIHSDLQVGDGGAGGSDAGSTLAVDGGTVNAEAELQLGNTTGADGRVTITGGSLLVTNAAAIIGNASGSTGTVTVSGGLLNAGGNDSTENLFVGLNGFGTLTVSGMGIVSGAQDVVIADGSGNAANSTVTVNGGLLYAGDNIEVGDASGAVGSFNVNGGTVSVVDEIRVGDASGSTGTMLVSGGTVTMGEELYVGFSGNGTATLAGGSVTAAVVVVANNSGAAGSTLSISGGGLTAPGDLNVNNSATLNVSGGALSVDTVDLGTASDALVVLNLSGGILTAADDINVSSGSGSTGRVVQTGGTLALTGGDPLNIGGGNSAVLDRNGFYSITNGTMTIPAGGDNGDLLLGADQDPSSYGILHVIGSGPTISVGDDFHMATNGTGELVVSLWANAIAAIQVGDDIDLNGTLTVSNIDDIAEGEYVIITNTTGDLNGVFDYTNWVGTATGRVVIADSYVSLVFAPEMIVLGTNTAVVIPDGDVTPAVDDGTDFGIVVADTVHNHTFTITNANATYTLNLTDAAEAVVLGGAHSNLFSVTVQPVVTNIAPIDATTFTIQFAPLVVGSYTATVSIASSDTSVTPYTYTIIGEGVLAAEPALNASNLTFSAVTNVAMTVSWDSGSGSNRILVARAGGPVSGLPVDGTAYAANAVFGSGDIIAADEYVVYSGAGTNVTVTGLSPCVFYYFALFEDNGSNGGINYLTDGHLEGVQRTLNSAPIITEGETIAVMMSENGDPVPFSLTLNGTDADTVEGDVITWSVLNAPPNGTASADGTGASVAVTYTPPLYYSGTEVFVVQAVDNCGDSDTIAITVTVSPINETGKVIYIFE
ncbi:MAG: choice-of-anchor D domain-containing protein [Verrucomicrobia bacterium]|nr:choice-of-anchor D domain-containing protein [Verrucomicrobiota bacterium]